MVSRQTVRPTFPLVVLRFPTPRFLFLFAFAFTLVPCPAAAQARFVRGDANADGEVNLSDSVATLQYLFLGGGAPSCLEAADADD